jgi:hypothetical protein
MSVRAFSRAVAIGAVLSMLASGIALADEVVADGDLIVGGEAHLGEVAAGAVIPLDVELRLECGGTKHVNSNQSVILSFSAIAEGGDVTGTDSVIPPPGNGWPADGSDCGTAPTPIPADPIEVTITAPTSTGPYAYTLMWTRKLSPSAVGDSGTFTTGTSVTVTLEVVGNVAPKVTVPGDMTVEGNTTGGATVSFTASATDPEDNPDPAASCTPASGSRFALGTTTVTCEVTDSGDKKGSASFSVLVLDTTPPSLDVSADVSVETTDPSGAVVTYPAASAADVVDDSVAAACLPATGSHFAVGDTTVTCSATDDSGNTAHASFTVHVALKPIHTWAAVWDEPIGDVERLSTGGGRTIPIKVRVFRDGIEVTSGSPVLAVTSCAGGPAISSASLEWGSGNNRWSGHLDTSGFAGGCYRVAVMVGDDAAGSFTLDITGSLAAAGKAANPRR